MGKKKKRKKMTKKQRMKLELRRKIIASSVGICVLFVLIIGLGFMLVNTSLINDKINATTASYITFKNAFENNDMIISNLRRTSDSRGMRLNDESLLEFDVKGKKNTKFDILIVPVNNTVDYKYINFYLTDSNDNVVAFDKLSDVSGDMLELKIYSDIISSNKKSNAFKLRLWIDKEYEEDEWMSSFEVKLKLK